MGDRSLIIANAMRTALLRSGSASGKSPLVQKPLARSYSIIDGAFDLVAAAAELERVLHESGFVITSAGIDE